MKSISLGYILSLPLKLNFSGAQLAFLPLSLASFVVVLRGASDVAAAAKKAVRRRSHQSIWQFSGILDKISSSSRVKTAQMGKSWARRKERPFILRGESGFFVLKLPVRLCKTQNPEITG